MINILVLMVACYTELENSLINLQTSLFNVYFMFNVSFETKLFMQYQKYFIKAVHMYDKHRSKVTFNYFILGYGLLLGNWFDHILASPLW